MNRKDILLYAKEFSRAVINGEVEGPEGDCFYCLMRDVETNTPLGELNSDTDHLRLHIEEKYYVASLLYRALEYIRAGDLLKSIAWDATHGQGAQWNRWENMSTAVFRRAIWRYLYKQFGIKRGA